MKTISFLICVATLFICNTSSAQKTTADKITGIWKGTSLCQVKNSPCHDENVVYHVTSDSTGRYAFLMNKIIDGKEEEMGTMIFILDQKKSTLISKDEKRNAEWIFPLKDNKISGRLIYRNQLYRLVEVTKQ